MQSEQSQQITKRFFEAFAALKFKGITTKNKFAVENGINIRNFWKIEKHPELTMIRVTWLQELVLKYNISADWLLTGRGNIFNA